MNCPVEDVISHSILKMVTFALTTTKYCNGSCIKANLAECRPRAFLTAESFIWRPK